MIKLFQILSLFLFIPQEINENFTEIKWVINSNDDYSFINNWEYATYVYKNNAGQLVCDGICPPETDNMRNENGCIFSDSIDRYYQLIDTTHIYYTIESETNCYEWGGTNNIIVQRTNSDTVTAYTQCNPATHCSLKLTIINNKCYPSIELNSITLSDSKIFRYISGYISIDKDLWKKDILKAKFYLNFEDNLWWQGKIYSRIN